MRGRRSAEQPNDSATAQTRQQRAVASPGKSFPTLSSMPRVHNAAPATWEYEEDAPPARRRAATTARPLVRPAGVPAREWETRAPWNGEEGWGDEDAVDGQDEYENVGEYDEEDAPPTPRALIARAPDAPALAGSRGAPLARPRVATQRLFKRMRSRWSLVRLGMAIVAAVVALVLSFGQVGEPAQPFMAMQARAASRGVLNVAQQVKPLTSLKRPDQYDNPTQFAIYSPAACSPSSMAEVLTAWGVPHATIGRMIDDLGSYLSPNWGLLDQKGFEVAAAKEGFRADISWHMTYNQVLYLTNVLGLPVIINVRRDWGYYHYFAGGHFLTVTGGDQQGVSIVDSSEYYITYLSRDVFYSLWQWRNDGTAQTVVLVPADYQYTVPAI